MVPRRAAIEMQETLQTVSELPYIDEHAIRIAGPRGVAWTALEQYVAAFLRRTEGGLLTRLLGTEPRAGFEIAERVPPDRLTLAGRHRFARYQLVFDLSEAANSGTELRATTQAEFPGLRGRAYRALVIGTRAHVVATTSTLDMERPGQSRTAPPGSKR
jgi:hypothetical protein